MHVSLSCGDSPIAIKVDLHFLPSRMPRQDSDERTLAHGNSGESDYTKPRALEISEVVRNTEAFEESKKKQEKAVKKGKEAELYARKLEVSLNGVR